MAKFLALLQPQLSLAQTCVSPALQITHSLFHWMWMWGCLKHNHNGNEQNSSCTWLPNTQTLETTLLLTSKQSFWKEKKKECKIPQEISILSITCIYQSWRYSILVERTNSCKLVLLIRPHDCSPTYFQIVSSLLIAAWFTAVAFWKAWCLHTTKDVKQFSWNPRSCLGRPLFVLLSNSIWQRVHLKRNCVKTNEKNPKQMLFQFYMPTLIFSG